MRVTGHNGQKPKRPQSKRPQTETATSRDGHRPKRPQTEMATDWNGHKPKLPQTEKSTYRKDHKPKWPHDMISQYIAMPMYGFWATAYP